jgi:DNA-binding transcriptional LysR family regulator
MAFDVRLLSGITVFCAVVETGNFVGAGVSLGLTQSGVSRAIQRLEEQLSARLLVRSPRSVTLTSEGRRFYTEAKPLLGSLEETAERVAGTSAAVRGHLRLNLDGSLARLVIGPRIGEFLAQHPELSVEICVRSEVGDLLGDGFDLALRFGEPSPSALIAQRLALIPVLTCASRDYVKRHGRPSHPDDLRTRDHECLLFHDALTGRPFAWEFHQKKKIITVPVSGRLTFDDGMSQVSACLAGCGVAQLFDWVIQEDLAKGRLINLFPDWSDERFPLYGYLPSSHCVPAKVRAFQAFVTRLLSDRKLRA